MKNIIYDKTNPSRRRALAARAIPKIENNAELKKKCLDHQYCLIAFLNGTNVEEENEKFYQSMGLLETYVKNPAFEKVKINWIDISCHKHLFEKLNGKDVPGLFFFYNWRDTYTIFKGLWEEFILRDFIERNLGDRIDAMDVPKKELIIETECAVTETSESTEETSSDSTSLQTENTQSETVSETPQKEEIRKTDL